MVLVGATGLEPVRGKPQRILSPLCLPIPARPHIMLHLSLVGGSKPNHGFHILDFSALNVIYFSTDVCRHLFEFFDFNRTYSPNMTSVQTRVRKHTLRNLPNAGSFSQPDNYLVSPLLQASHFHFINGERNWQGGIRTHSAHGNGFMPYSRFELDK